MGPLDAVHAELSIKCPKFQSTPEKIKSYDLLIFWSGYDFSIRFHDSRAPRFEPSLTGSSSKIQFVWPRFLIPPIAINHTPASCQYKRRRKNILLLKSKMKSQILANH